MDWGFLKQRSGAVRWILILGLGVLPGLLIDPHRMVDAFAPLAANSLEVPSVVNLGTLKPFEKRAVSIDLKNQSGHRILLRSIETDCGCLVVNGAPTALEAGEAASVKVSILGPTAPGEFSKSLVIQSRADGGPIWRIAVRGQVAADVWSEPAQLDMQLESSPTAEAELQLHHVADFKLGRVAAQSANVQIVESQETADGQRLRIRIEANSATDVASTSLNVFSQDHTDAPVLAIPIRWRPQAVVGYVPQRLDLRQFDREASDGDRFRRVVAVVVPRERRAEEVEVKSLAPWVHVAKQDCDGSVLRLEVEFARDEMPTEFQQPILSARLADQPVGDELFAAGYRGQSH
jgi:uncharacterized protein DUF1573